MKMKDRIRAAKYAAKIAKLGDKKRALLKIADDFEMCEMQRKFADAISHGCADKEMENALFTEKEINRLAWLMAKSMLLK